MAPPILSVHLDTGNVSIIVEEHLEFIEAWCQKSKELNLTKDSRLAKESVK